MFRQDLCMPLLIGLFWFTPSDIMSQQIEAQLQELFTVLNQLQVANYIDVVTLTVLAYDWALSLDAEVRYIWQSSWSLVKVLYILARYYGFARTAFIFFVDIAIQPSKPLCVAHLWIFTVGSGMILVTGVNIIFMLRIQALYHRSRLVLIVLPILIIIEFALESYITIYEAVQDKIEPTPVLPFPISIPGCTVNATVPTKLELISWLPCLVVATIMFGMTMYKFATMSESGYPRGRRPSLSPLQKVFLKDGTVFFLLIFTSVLTSTILDQTVPPALRTIGISVVMSVYSLSGSKLILRLRENAKEVSTSFTTQSSLGQQISDVAFGGLSRPVHMISLETELQTFSCSDH